MCGALASAGSVVEDVLQNLARLEGQHAARADGDLLASLGVAPGTRVLVAHHEVPEAGDLDLLPALQRLLDRVEHGLDDLRGLLLREPTHLLVDVLNNVGLRHDHTFYIIEVAGLKSGRHRPPLWASVWANLTGRARAELGRLLPEDDRGRALERRHDPGVSGVDLHIGQGAVLRPVHQGPEHPLLPGRRVAWV